MSADDVHGWRRWWWRQQFTPGLAAVFINPFFFARRGLAAAMADLLPRLTGEVLDVGCGRKPYRHLVPAKNYTGIDLDTPELRAMGAAEVFYDGRTIPLADGSHDAVLCSQVLEHVFTPAAFVADLHRVLRPGGLLLLTTPFVWDEHSQPFDFGRYSSFGLASLLESAGFEIVVQRKTCADATALVQLATGSLYKVTRSRHRPLNWAVQLLMLGPLNLLGGLLAALLPRNPDFYLDNVFLARRRS
jgi:SAM-dependent methyltransferase